MEQHCWLKGPSGRVEAPGVATASTQVQDKQLTAPLGTAPGALCTENRILEETFDPGAGSRGSRAAQSGFCRRWKSEICLFSLPPHTMSGAPPLAVNIPMRRLSSAPMANGAPAARPTEVEQVHQKTLDTNDNWNLTWNDLQHGRRLPAEITSRYVNDPFHLAKCVHLIELSSAVRVSSLSIDIMNVAFVHSILILSWLDRRRYAMSNIY